MKACRTETLPTICCDFFWIPFEYHVYIYLYILSGAYISWSSINQAQNESGPDINEDPQDPALSESGPWRKNPAALLQTDFATES